MKEPSLKTVDVNGTQLHYLVFGENNKQSVIFTPANTMSTIWTKP
jgi:hypothetical protein